MECPHCCYDPKARYNKDVYYPPFFKLSNKVVMETMESDSDEVRDVYGCPECNKLFMV